MTKNAAAHRTAIHNMMDDSDAFTIGCLLYIHSFQTAAEQDWKSTEEENGVGFNKIDAGPMSDISEFYLSKGFLTEKQISFVRRTIKKYHSQLHQDITPRPIKPLDKKPNGGNNGVVKRVERLDDKKLKITFRFPRGDARFRETVAEIKSKLDGRRWEPELAGKPWTAPLSIDNVSALIDMKFEMPPDLVEWHSKISSPVYKPGEIIIPGLGGILYPFQKDGVAWIENRNGRALIADEMGLGKTVQALAWLQLHPEARPAVIVCPASVKLNWEREARRWMADPDVIVLFGRYDPDNIPPIKKNSIIITNYDILPNKTIKEEQPHGQKPKKIEIKNTGWGDYLKKIKINTLVIDESHYTKNGRALRTKAVKRLAKYSENMIALSGTPITNRPIEFYNTIDMVNPAIFPNFWTYAKKYCGAKNNGWGWDFTGATNTKQLHRKLTSTIMLRRKKSEVLPDLPAKVRSVIPLEIDNRKEYSRAAANILKWIRENEGEEQATKASNAEVLVEFEKLKQLAVKGKMDSVIQWIQDFIDVDGKLVVFADHKSTIDMLMDNFGKVAVKIDGSVPQKKRQAVVDRFQEDESIRLFIGSKAAKEGITLTASSNTCFLELWWVPGDHSQAEDRVHRIGQEDDSVNAWYLIAQDTVEEKLVAILDEKQKVLASTLDGEDVDESTVLGELLRSYKEAA
jgi:SNF2 family DNA or RNA helicase